MIQLGLFQNVVTRVKQCGCLVGLVNLDLRLTITKLKVGSWKYPGKTIIRCNVYLEYTTTRIYKMVGDEL